MLDYSKLPNPAMLDAVRNYVDRGARSDSWLRAVLENNLMDAFRHADDINVALIREWCVWIYNEMPNLAYGSPELVRRWMLARRGELEDVDDDVEVREA